MLQKDLLQVTDREFQQIVDEHRHELTGLKVWFNKLKNYSLLTALTKLEQLDISDWASSDLTPLQGLGNLRRLRIFHLPKVRDLSPIGSLTNLVSLKLNSPPSWDASNKRLQFASLAPLANLHNLKELDLCHSKVEKEGLRPLAELTTLKKLKINFDFPIEDFAYLSLRLTQLDRPLGPIVPSAYKCEKCNESKVFLVGKGRKRRPGLPCWNCRRKVVNEHIAEFEAAQTKFEASND